MNRRIVSAALIFVLANLEGVTSSTTICNMTNPCAYLGQGSEYLEEPRQLRDPHSSWSVTQVVEIGTVTFNWLTLFRRLYNGERVGPTINVRPGDELGLNLINTLSPVENDNGNGVNEQRYPNSTNMHTHGLHISSEYGQDNVLIKVDPWRVFPYTYQIDEHNSPGTYWYHAHVHGSTAFQVNGGMSGMLIVEDDIFDMPHELSAASCPLNCDKDIQLVFQPMLIFGGRRGYEKLQDDISDYEGFKNDQYVLADGSTLSEWLAENVHYVTTNGQLQPKLEMTTGQIYRFRMVNAGGHPNLEVYIIENSIDVPTPKCQIREIATDGIYLPSPRRMHSGQSLIAPGSRVDWLVICHTPGTYKLASYHYPTSNLSIGAGDTFDDVLVTLVVSGSHVESSFPTTLPSTFHGDLRNAEVEQSFVVEMDPDVHLNRELWSEPFKYRYKMTLGKVQEWTVLNSHRALSHPLHIHVNHFQVISYNNYTGGFGLDNDETWYLNDINDINRNCYYQHPGYTPDTGIHEPPEDAFDYLGHDKRHDDLVGSVGYARIGDWKDTLLIPPLVNITIRFIPIDFTGDVVIHCHILQHEDAGMMMVVGIVDEGESTDADIAAGNAYPGTCRKCDRYPPNNPTNLCGETDHGTSSWYYGMFHQIGRK